MLRFYHTLCFIRCTLPGKRLEVSFIFGEGETTTRPIGKPNSVQESNANRWDPEKVELFHNSVDDKVDIIKVLENEIKYTTVENVSLEFINNIVERTGEILVRSAKDTFGEKPVRTNKFSKQVLYTKSHGSHMNVKIWG